MRFLTPVLLLASLFVAFAVSSDVLDLTTDTFDEAIAKNQFILVEFYAPWCGHCKHLAPHYEEAATTVKDEGIVLAKVDGTQEQDLMTRFQIRGFPTLFFFRNGNPIPYSGDRTAAGIVGWVRKKSGPAATTLTSEDEVNTFNENNKVTIIGHLAENSDEYKALFEAASAGAVEPFAFGVVTDSSVTSAVGRTQGNIVLKRSFDSDLVFDGTVDANSLVEWVLTNGYPLLEHAQVSWGRLREKGNPIGLLIFDEEGEDSQATLDLVTSLAKQYSKSFSFAFIGKQYLNNAKEMGISGEKIPTIVVLNSLGKSYPYPDSNEFNQESLSAWLEGIASGSVKPLFKSAPVPETNDGPVTVVVGNTFDEIVINSDKDVFIEFYAPWCGHCKQLAPIFEQLGEHYAKNIHVTIAKLDATVNDNTAVQISGYPTLYLFPANDKQNPVEYNGPRDVQSMIDFISQHGSWKGEHAAPDHSHEHGEGHDHSHDHEL